MESFGRFAWIFARAAVALASLWWIYARIPLAREILRRLSAVLASPLSVFVLCHVIVASVIADSRKLSLRSRTNRGPNGPAAKPESGGENDAVGEAGGDEIAFEDKEVVSETKTTAIGAEEEAPSLLRRWRSESSERGHLRRSESEKRFEVSDPAENSDSRDELSDEDFNRTVEAFIAKQLKFRRQELVFPASSLCETSPEVSSLCSSLSTAINA